MRSPLTWRVGSYKNLAALELPANCLMRFLELTRVVVVGNGGRQDPTIPIRPAWLRFGTPWWWVCALAEIRVGRFGIRVPHPVTPDALCGRGPFPCAPP